MDNLIAPYQQRLNLQNANFSQIEHDDAMVAVVYRVTQSSGTELILKICPRDEDYRREVYFLKYFADKLPVPRIVQVVQPETGISGAVLMECLPGAPLKITDISDALAYEIGSLLARIHLNRAVGYGDLTQPDDLTLDPRVYFTLKFEEGIAECSDHLPKVLIDQCRRYYDTHIHLLALVDGPCMIHRDFRPGNVIVHEGKLQGIIDWAGGRGSFAEEDFCPMEHWEWPLHPTSKKSFLSGYANIRPIPNYSAIMPLLRLSRALNVIGFTVKRGTWKSNYARVYQFNRRFLDTFFRS
jgi:Ser/Thr protein kinase RdoA (MazF antagonist)